AVPVRGGRRVALPGVRHQHHHRAAGPPRGPPPRPRPRRGPHPARQGLRPGTLPSREFGINQTWLLLTGIAADLIAWTRLLALTGEATPLAACEPKALRYRFLHVPARLTHAARRRRLRIPK